MLLAVGLGCLDVTAQCYSVEPVLVLVCAVAASSSGDCARVGGVAVVQD